ncbi:hypothetical protein LZ017_21590 [Pelomonas sp. CA6]|uniref:hypothetical protein n=1 Tax=Pelomonas sp. CA6 TaxID=2907999 RepID=UPI001F4C1E51|nr:hypothetical protein [Pelomonas sp. CA6]MCH7345969.1 hypothetical protein [Pelomonas sp. CA6]
MSSPTPPLNPPAAANDVAQRPSDSQWGEIVQQLGAEIAGPLSAALERIHQLSATGQIDRQGLRTLKESVQLAREAGMVGQQLARLASGRLRLSRERVHLTQVLRGVLAQRSRETQARGIQVRQVLKPIEVIADGSLLFSLLNAMMDWALINTHSSLELRLDLTPWPAKARLVCRFAHRAMDLADTRADLAPPPLLNSLTWRLVEQTALTMGVLPLREDESSITVLTLEFPNTLSDEPGVALPERPRDDPTPSHNSKPLAGCHLLIVSPRRELRVQIQEAIRHMGLIVDVVGNMDEAALFCQDGLPHGILFENAQRGPALERLRAEVLGEVPNFCFVEVLDQEHLTQLSTATSDHMARISRTNIADALPSVLLFELSKSL